MTDGSPTHHPADDDPPDAAPRAPSLSSLYARHWGEIVAFIRQTCGAGPPDPEDAAQTAFTQFAALEHPEDIDNPRAFLFRSARNHVVDYKRRETVRRREQLTVILGSETVDHIDAQRVLEAKERVAILNGVLQKLSQRHRDVLLMHRIEGLTFAEIAERSGFSQSLAKKLAQEALTKCDRAIRKADRS